MISSVGPHVVDLFPLDALCFEEAIDPIESHAPIVADDPPTPVGVWKTSNDPRPSAAHDLRRVGIKYAVVVRLSVFRECLLNVRIGIEARGLEPSLHHPEPAKGEDRPA